MNLAIVIGVNKYTSNDFGDLPACYNDAATISEVLNNVKIFKEILYLNSNETGHYLKNQISNFIGKYKDSHVDEFVFYFSGHGERFEDDFFYLPHDFSRDKKEATGLRNSELDGWIKSISPKLCVKIVDACFSGTQYIKSESNTEKELKKSAEKYGLNDLYFWFSSREDEASYAGSEFSRFTESILTAITEHEGEIRYRDIMAYVADEFSNAGTSKPVFITQADNIEKFGEVSKETHQIILKAFGLEGQCDVAHKENIKKNDESIYDLIKKVSSEQCFSEQDAIDFISRFNQSIGDWGSNLSEIYEIIVDRNVSSNSVPNANQIGNWLSENRKSNYFSTPSYSEREYEEEEYKALPKKPKKSGYLSSFDRLAMYGFELEEDNTEYRLETVKKTQKYIDGFRYTHTLNGSITSITFESKIEILQPFSLYIIPIYSNSKFIFHYSYEELQRSNWDNYSKPKCKDWRLLDVKINSADSVNASSEHIKGEILKWVEEKLKKVVGR